MMNDNRRQLVDNIRIAIADIPTETEILKAAAQLIESFSEGHNWTGFYMMRGDSLELGPYVGPQTPHTRIELNQGICGAAASEKQSIIVDDVKADSRHLVCSTATRSEIVVPLMDSDTCLGEIDIDSNQSSFFTAEDREMLEEVAAVIVRRLKEIRQ